MTKEEFLNLQKKYGNSMKTSGYTKDEDTGAIIIYALNALYLNNTYYSLKTGKQIEFESYVKSIRKYVGNIPLQLSGTAVIVYRKKGKKYQVLLQLRKDFNMWGLPGGGIELGETYEECAANELLQETSYLADKSKFQLFNVYAGPKHITKYPNGDITFHTTVAYFVNEKDCMKLGQAYDGTETHKIDWFTTSELISMCDAEKIFANNVHIIRDIVEKFSNLED